MAPRIQVPPNTLRMTCPKSHQRRFTTKENEERIHLASEDRKARLELRNRRRQDKSAENYFSEEAEKAEEELKLKEGFLKKLARNENTGKGFSGEDRKGNMTEIESNVQRVKHGTTEALRYIVP
jgi:hypothetical protein